MIELTDAQVTTAARELTPNPNCGAILDYSINGATKVCKGKLEYRDGGVQFNGCGRGHGRYCVFMRETLPRFDDNVTNIITVVAALNKVLRDQ